MRLEFADRAAYAYTGGRACDPTLPAVVFVHGALHDHSVWGLQSRHLAHQAYTVLAVDLPGHGRTPGPALGVEAAGRWLVSVIAAAGLQRVAVVGHSMGSLIALEAAALLGARALALVMVGSAYPMQVSPRLLQLCQSDVEQAMGLVNALSISTHAAKPSVPGPGFSLHGGNLALMRRMQRGYTGGHLFLEDFSACDVYRGLPAAAARVTCPVTLVLGTRDQMTPPKSAAPLIEALAPRVVRLASGHHLMGETPDELLHALREALLDAKRGA